MNAVWLMLITMLLRGIKLKINDLFISCRQKSTSTSTVTMTKQSLKQL